MKVALISYISAGDFFQAYQHPDLGQYRLMKPPVRFAKSPSNIRRHPPKLGEHTDEILAEFGVEAEGEDA